MLTFCPDARRARISGQGEALRTTESPIGLPDFMSSEEGYCHAEEEVVLERHR